MFPVTSFPHPLGIVHLVSPCTVMPFVLVSLPFFLPHFLPFTAALPYLLILVSSPLSGISCPEDLCCMCLLVCFDRQGPDLVSDPAATRAEGCVSLALDHIFSQAQTLTGTRTCKK